MRQLYSYRHKFQLESGESLPNLKIAYHTYSDPTKPVVWICHHLTANSDAMSWWTSILDPDNYYIVCSNIIGSCYGSTGPNKKQFPLVTIRDMVKAHQLLRQKLKIEEIHLLIGGSMGGYQVLKWAILEPQIIKQICVLATSAAETAWGIAIHQAQRLAIEAANFKPTALKADRAIGMLTYRNYECFQQTQNDPDTYKLKNFRAASYIIYQGDKLVNRFNPFAYYHLTRSMDTHNLARGRGRIEEVVNSIQQRSLIIGITSDILCPLPEQEFLAAHIRYSKLITIDSMYGHDGFLTETKLISKTLQQWQYGN